MEERRKKRRLMSLAQCGEELRQPGALGDLAPALVTLKRWKAAGKLKPAMVAPRQGMRRPSFDLDEVIRIARAARTERPTQVLARDQVHIVQSPPPERLPHAVAPDAGLAEGGNQPPTTWPAASVPGPDGAALMALLTQMCTTMEEIKESLGPKFRAIEGGLGTLNASRLSLMEKYDAQNQGFRRRIEDLERENDTLRKSGSVVDISKLNTLLSRVNDHLAGQAGR